MANHQESGLDNHPAISQLDRGGLPFAEGGVVLVDTPEALDKILAHSGQDLSSVTIDFVERRWRELDAGTRAKTFKFLGEALEQVCAAGILPRSRDELPSFGTRVEAMVIGGKPVLRRKYGTGTVFKLGWDSVFRTWRVGVQFDETVGYWCGMPINGVSAFPNQIHVIGSTERPFSEMTLPELDALHEERRQEFWRNVDPATGMSDPALRVPRSGRAGDFKHLLDGGRP